MQKAVLVLSGIKKSFTQGDVRIQVINGIDAQFEQSSTYAITGASGTGKSTLLHIMAGLDTPDAGTVCFNDQNIFTLPSQQKSNFFSRAFLVVSFGS